MAGFWDFIPTILSVGATLYGAAQKSDADKKAAATEVAAQQAATAAQVAGYNNAAANTAANQAAASPGLIADQAIIARGTALTPAQQQAVTDANTTAINALNGTGLRGSARATAATVADTTARNTATFEQQNQNNANAAAAQLTGNYFAAGNNLATNAANIGNVTSQGLVNTGNIQGSNQVGQGALTGQAIGDVGALAANTIKSGIAANNGIPAAPAASTAAQTPNVAVTMPTPATPDSGMLTGINPATGLPIATPSQYNKIGQNSGVM